MFVFSVFNRENFFRAATINVDELIATNEDWRKKEAKLLTDLVQKRINYVQVSLYLVLKINYNTFQYI